MDLKLTNRILLIVLILVCIGSLIAYFELDRSSSQSLEEVNQKAAQFAQKSNELEERLEEVLSEYQGMLQENTALRQLLEAAQETKDDAPAVAEAPAAIPVILSLPKPRVEYLTIRLEYASKQLYRLRKRIQQHGEQVAEITEPMPFGILLPQSREEYLAIRLEYASKQLKRLRKQVRQLDAQAAENNVDAKVQDFKDLDETEMIAKPTITKVDYSDMKQKLLESVADKQRLDAEISELRQELAKVMAQKQRIEAVKRQVEAEMRQIDAENARLAARLEELGENFNDERDYYERAISGLADKLNQVIISKPVSIPTPGSDYADSQSDQPVQQITEQQDDHGVDEENIRLRSQLRNLNDQIELLTAELKFANIRTENMEEMANAINQENILLGVLIEDLRKTMDITIAEKIGEITKIQSGYTIIEFSTDILFESGSAVLSDRGKLSLDELVSIIDQESMKNRVVSVEGHTDNVPIGEQLLALYPSNWELSIARAESATQYLVDQGVSADRLRTVGFGSRRPIATNESEEGRASNRRIEIHLVPELRKKSS